MTLCDAGPLIAMVNPREPRHRACWNTLSELRLPLLTTWPVFAEAMHLLGTAAGWFYQEQLWRMLEGPTLFIHPLDEALQPEVRDLMAKYADLPMDLADATLVALAEAINIRRIFTLDADFGVYRLKDRTAFEVAPVAR